MTDAGHRHTNAITVGYDGSQGAQAALQWAIAWANTHNADLHLLTVTNDEQAADDPPAPDRTEVSDAFRQAGASTRGQVAVQQRNGDTTAELVAASDTSRLVALGARARGEGPGRPPGSVAAAVAVASHGTTVLVEPGREVEVEGPVVVCVDGSPESLEAAEFGFIEAAVADRALIALHVGDPGDRDEARLQRSVEQVAAATPEVPWTLAVQPDRAEECVSSLSSSASLLVAGSRGLGGHDGLPLGSFGLMAICHARCPVAIVRSGGAAVPARAPLEPVVRDAFGRARSL